MGCQSCSVGISTEEFCRKNPGYAGCPPPPPAPPSGACKKVAMCKKALITTACCKPARINPKCCACSLGCSEENYCKGNPRAPGCRKCVVKGGKTCEEACALKESKSKIQKRLCIRTCHKTCTEWKWTYEGQKEKVKAEKAKKEEKKKAKEAEEKAKAKAKKEKAKE